MYKIIEGDQKTDEWLKLREGCAITGSNAKKVKGDTKNAYFYETLAMMTTVRERKDLKGIADIDRGNELEPEARVQYERFTKTKVRQVSFIEHENGRYGISPDGLIMRGQAIKKLLEIKCPDSNNHIRYIIENKIPAEHLDQIIHGFIICDDVDEIDFVSYDPKFKFKPLFIITARRRDLIVEISTAQIQYQKFIEKLDKAYATLIL